MKTHVTNLYGFIKDKEVANRQRKFAQTAHDMGIYELGLYVYDVSSDTDTELSKRLDGIIASVEHDDMAIVQLPTGNGLKFESMLIEKIVAYSNKKIIVLWHDEAYKDINESKLQHLILKQYDAWTLNEYSDETIAALINNAMKSEDTFDINVLNIDETLDYILEHNSSVARFGDGEMDIIAGNSIPYQQYDYNLAQQLRQIMMLQSNEKMVVCLSDVFKDRDRYNSYASDFWKHHLDVYRDFYTELCTADWYGSTFISRPYMDLIDKTSSKRYFNKLKQLWENKNILIVEGVNSRSGVGNDLFDNAMSVKRIICPAKNAYSKIDVIKEHIIQYADDRLILIMLGPTAKVLAYELSLAGYQAIDIGHIDSEYEWFKMGATSKVKLNHKHTAEHNFDENIIFCDDDKYNKEIIGVIVS